MFLNLFNIGVVIYIGDSFVLISFSCIISFALKIEVISVFFNHFNHFNHSIKQDVFVT